MPGARPSSSALWEGQGDKEVRPGCPGRVTLPWRVQIEGVCLGCEGVCLGWPRLLTLQVSFLPNPFLLGAVLCVCVCV